MRVFVFGAGASKPAGLPLGRDLYGSLRAYILKRSGEDDGYSDVACRLKDLEQQGVLGNSDDFELDLTRLDVRIKSKDAPPLFRSVRQELADTLTDHFNALQNEIATVTARLSYLEGFAQTHIHEGDAIITFNYDCLLERVLHGLGLWTIEDGYGFQRTLTNSSLDQPEGRSPCKVLKLHGSVGWISSVINFDFFIQEEPLAFVGYPKTRDSAYKKFGGQRATILPSYVKEVLGSVMFWRFRWCGRLRGARGFAGAVLCRVHLFSRASLRREPSPKRRGRSSVPSSQLRFHLHLAQPAPSESNPATPIVRDSLIASPRPSIAPTDLPLEPHFR